MNIFVSGLYKCKLSHNNVTYNYLLNSDGSTWDGKHPTRRRHINDVLEPLIQSHPKFFQDLYNKAWEGKSTVDFHPRSESGLPYDTWCSSLENFLRILHWDEPFRDLIVNWVTPNMCIIVDCGNKDVIGSKFSVEGFDKGISGHVPPFEEKYWERISD
jgi:hypothetical protein